MTGGDSFKYQCRSSSAIINPEIAINDPVTEIAGKQPEAHQLFFRSSSDAVILFDPRAEAIIDCTDEALRLLRYTREALLAHGLRRLFPECSAQFSRMVEIPDQAAEFRLDTMALLDGTGVERGMSVVCRVLHLENGPVVSATLKDPAAVTGSMDLPELSPMTRQRLVNAAPFFVTGKVHGGFIHEINNANNVILMNASLLREFWNEWSPLLAGIPADGAEFEKKSLPFMQVLDALPRLMDGIRGASERVKTVTDVAGNLATGSVHRGKDLDINVVVKNCILLLTSTIHKRAKELVVILAEDLPHVQGNLSDLMAVVIATALKMLEPDGGGKKIFGISTMRADAAHVFIRIFSGEQGEGSQGNEGLRPLVTSRSCPPLFSDLSSLLVESVVESYGGKAEYRYSSGEMAGIACMRLYWPVVSNTVSTV